ncbi:MAG TPA: substrate-binding domain-containing protein, partial [Candidatus Scatomonas merdavium]|nr:substrate-binding domain-containing protein [Candidatus Scatomonas merdavium]
EYVMETGYEAAEIILQNKNRPDAILCDTDILAVGVLRNLKNHGIEVPDDMMLISCDDIDIASYYCPRLTTLHVPIQEISIKAMQLLIGQIENQTIDCNGREFELQLIERETTKRK